MNSPEFIKTGRRNLKPSQQQEVQQKVQNLMGDSLYKSKKNFYRKIQEKQNKFEGYQISVQIPKEKSYDEKYKEKYIDFINKFFSNGHFEMSVFLPHIFGDQQIQNFKEEYQDLNFQMKKIVFEEADYQFYQRIYQFKGQIEPEIQPKVQMLIYDFIFKKIISQTQGTSYSFIYDYHTCQCSVYLPNTNLHSPKEATQFFISNVLQEFNQYAILQIETNSQEECLAQSKLIKSLIEKLEKKMDTKIELVYISLQKLKLEGNWNDWFKQQLKSDKIYLVYQKTNLDQQTMNIDMTKFISDQINRKSMQFQIEIDDPPEDEDQQLQALKIHYKNISIEKDKPFKKTQDGLIVEFTLSGWYTSLVEQEKINSSHVEIKQKLNSIYKPFYQIKLTNQDQIHIWVHYLKDQLTPDEQKQIKDEQQQKPNNYIIKISTTFQDYEQLSKKIQQQLQQVLINIVKIKIVNKKLSSALIDQDINQNTFQQILNNFQQNVQDKLLKVIILENNHQEFKFQVINEKKYTPNQIEDFIKNGFINQLQVQEIHFKLSSKNLMDLPTQFQDGHIIVLQYNGKTQNIIAKKQLIDELIPYLKQIEKNIQQQTIQIRFTIQHDKLGNELKAKLKEFLSCVSTYDQESCLFTIELLKQDFENVTLVLKEFAQQYHKINFCEAKQIMNDLNQDSIDFRELEKNQKVIIYIQKFYTYDPIYASRSQLSYDNRKINLVQGKISEIQCQAVVLQFLKNYDYSNVILQDNQIKDILMQADDRSLLLKSWKKQMEQGNQLSDVKMMELSKTNYIKFLFQIYPQFYKNSSNLRKNLIHIQALIKEVFKQAKQNQIKQIAFPLIGVELFGYTVKAIQQVLVLQIISEFSQKDCSVDQVFVVDVCETNLNQLDEYFRSFQEQKRPDSALSSRQVNPSQIAQWQIEKGGDLIEIEDPEVNDLISNRYRLQNQSSNFEPLLINYRFSKVPHTHLVDMKNKKIFNIRIFKEQRIDFIELFQQRLYFIDYQQVDANLNRYLLIRHEQFQQEEFELFYLQDEVITVNTQFYIQTKGRDDKKKIIRSGKLSERQDWIESDCQAQNQANFTYQTIQANSKQHQPKINTFQLQISSDSEEKNEKALETIKKFHQMQTSNRQRNNQN